MRGFAPGDEPPTDLSAFAPATQTSVVAICSLGRGQHFASGRSRERVRGAARHSLRSSAERGECFVENFLSYCLSGCACAAAFADTPSTTVRGTVAAVSDDAKSLTMKSRAGAEVKVQLEPKTIFVSVVRASAADLKPNSFIGVAAVPSPTAGSRR